MRKKTENLSLIPVNPALSSWRKEGQRFKVQPRLHRKFGAKLGYTKILCQNQKSKSTNKNPK